MKRIIGTTIAAAVVFAAFGTAAFAQDAKAVEKGRQLFTEQKCTLCHSAEGKGSKKDSLDTVGSDLSAAEIKQWITDPKGMTAKTKATRKPVMKEYKNLSAADVDALVAYLSTLKKK